MSGGRFVPLEPRWKNGLQALGSPVGTPSNLEALLHVSPVLSFHLPSEAFLLDEHVDLEIAQQARCVQVARSDPRPATVRNHGLGVQHRSIPFVNADACLEQFS